MKNTKNTKNIEVRWGGGESSLFLDLTGKQPRVLDFEYDGCELHERCGGTTYYESRSGRSGAGWLKHLGTLLPLGSYRVDTRYNNTNSQIFRVAGRVTIGCYADRKLQILVPYASHCVSDRREEILRQYPTVIKIDDNIIIYCDFYRNLTEVLKNIFVNEGLPEERCHKLKQIFLRADEGEFQYKEELSVQFYNLLCSGMRLPDPWEFCLEMLQGYGIGRTERLFRLLGVERLQDYYRNDTFVKVVKIAGWEYRGELLEGNPLEAEKLPAGWQRLADDVLVRFYDNSQEAHLVAYTPAKAAYEKLARRFAYHMGESEEFISFVSAHDGEYVEFELVVPKVLYLLDQSAQLAKLRKGLARKVREDVASRVRQWIDDVDDRELLEAVPDDLVITFTDSLEAGNCRPGTQEFVDQNFPGQTQTTAKELKKFFDNYHVMRIFRHLAETGQFSCHKSA